MEGRIGRWKGRDRVGENIRVEEMMGWDGMEGEGRGGDGRGEDERGAEAREAVNKKLEKSKNSKIQQKNW